MTILYFLSNNNNNNTRLDIVTGSYAYNIRKMYQGRLRRLGASDNSNKSVNVTRLKDEFLDQIPGLCEKRDGKRVILTAEDVRKALLEFSQSSLKDDRIIISKAALFYRKNI